MKKLRNLIIILMFMIIFSLLVLGCANNDSENSSGKSAAYDKDEIVVLKAGSINSPTSIASIVSNEMVEEIYEITDGTLEIEYYDSEQLGNGEAQVENLRTGLQDMAVSDPGWLAALDKDINVIGMPY